MALTVGFDLDMTLIDSRPGIGAVYDVLAAETGVPIDSALVTSRLGPPLETELANWFPADQVTAMAARYRELYPELAIPNADPLPGAVDALASVRRHGGRTVVVSSKKESAVRLHVEHLGLDVDALVGGVYAAGKGPALASYGAAIYVGDHLADIEAARAAGAFAVGVATGPFTARELRDGGADVALDSLVAFPDWLDRWVLSGALTDRLRALGRVVVAFSGGADSAFLLAAAVRTLGAGNVVAATAVSPSLAAAELTAAREFAAGLGVRHVEAATDELARPGYVANGRDRCFHCKAELLDVLTVLAGGLAAQGLARPADGLAGGLADLGDGWRVATGTNADDARSPHRPGMAAAAERGAVTPLKDAGLTKAQVRALSRDWGLATWDKPALACLSSRVAYGVPISAGRLAAVERAETALRVALDGAGFDVRNLRVRDLGDGRARIEVDADLVPALAARSDLLEAVPGFSSVSLDTTGFRSGSMNENVDNAIGRAHTAG